MPKRLKPLYPDSLKNINKITSRALFLCRVSLFGQRDEQLGQFFR